MTNMTSTMAQRFPFRYANGLLAASLFVVTLLWAGCDSQGSNNKPADDTSRFIGTWDAQSLTISPVNLNVLGNYALVATFGSGGTVQVVVSDNTGELANLSGQYTVNTSSGKVTLSGSDFSSDLVMGYTFDSDTQLKLTFTGSDLEGLGIDLGSFGGVVAGQNLTATLKKRT